MIETDLKFCVPSTGFHRGVLCTAVILGTLGACVDDADLGDVPGETEAVGGTQGDGDSGSTQAETTAGSTEGETADTEGETESADTEGEAEGSVGTCEIVRGEPGDLHSWALVCGSEATERIELLETTASGDVLVGVHTRLDEGATPTVWEIGESQYTHSGLTNVLLLRLDSTGEIEWSRYLSSEADGQVWLQSIAACGEGFVIMADTGEAPLDYGDGTLEGGEFLARFGEDGTLQWSRSFDVMQPDGHITATDAHCDVMGNVALAGAVRDGVDFGAGMVPAGVSDGFVAKYDADGELLFGKSLLADPTADGSEFAVVSAVALLDDGSTYAFLSHNAPVDLGDGPIEPANPDSGDQALLVRLTDSGDLQWSASIGGEGLVYARDLQVDAGGRAFVSGLFLSFIELGGTVHENVFPFDEQQEDIVGTNYDAFLAVFEADGTYAWGEPLGWMRDEEATLGRFAGDQALVYRVSERQISVSVHAVDGNTELIGAEFEAPNRGLQYRLMRATDDAFVLGGTIDEQMTWPFDLSRYASGNGDAIAVHFDL